MPPCLAPNALARRVSGFTDVVQLSRTRIVMEDPQVAEQKRVLRASTIALRNAQEQKAERSRRIIDRFLGLSLLERIQTVAIYVSTASEVNTHGLIEHCWTQSKQVVVPCCLADELQLFRVESWSELAPRTLGILEPRDELISRLDRQIAADEVDLFAVPGLAFDRRGGRLGFGKGYYDRLLSRSSRRSQKVGLAFDCQILEEVPMGSHDVFMDLVVTETSVHKRTEA